MNSKCVGVLLLAHFEALMNQNRVELRKKLGCSIVSPSFKASQHSQQLAQTAGSTPANRRQVPGSSKKPNAGDHSQVPTAGASSSADL